MKKPRLRLLRNNRGVIFLATMIALFIMALTATMVYELTTQNVHMTNYIQKSTQARYLAEAGLAHAFAVLKSDFNNWNNASAFPTQDLGTGTFHATVGSVGSRYLVTSAGTVQGVTRVATAEVKPPPTTASAFDYAIALGGSGSIDSGTGQSPGTITGNPNNGNAVYAQGSLTLDGPSSGGVLAIDGNVHAGGSIAPPTASVQMVSGTLQSNYPTTVTFPTPDMTTNYYYNTAYANRSQGTYYDGTPGYTYTPGVTVLPANPPGGVIYFKEDVIFKGTITTTACIFVEGSLAIVKSGSTYPRIRINQSGNLPAIVCTESMSFSSTGNGGAYLETNGLVYVSGSFAFSSGNHDHLTMNGPLVVKGSLAVSPQSWNNASFRWTSVNPPGFNTINGGAAQMTVVSYNQ